MSGSESEEQAFVGDLKVGHALVSGYKVGVIMVIGLESGGRLKERAGNGGYTSGVDECGVSFQNFQAKNRRTNVTWLQT